MKILMVSRFSILDRFAGTFRYIHDLSCELASRGHEVYWISKKECAEEGKYVEQIAPRYWIYRIGIKKRFPLWNTWLMMRSLRDLAEELDDAIGIDLVCLHSMSAGPLLSKSKLCKRVPFVGLYYAPVFFEYTFNQRSLIGDYPFLKRIYSKLRTWVYSQLQYIVERFVLQQFEQIVALSQYSINQLEEYYDPSLTERAIAIPAGVDIYRFKPAKDKTAIRKRLGLPIDATIFFTLRNLMPRMGLEPLIDAMGLIIGMDKASQVLLYIGGKGPLRERLQVKISNSHLEDVVKMVGFISDEDLPAYYQASDFFVLPTEALEGFGIVTIEALASNTPVIATPIGATPEILTKVGGFLTNSATPEDLAAKMQYAIENRKEILNQWDSRSVVESEYSWQVVGSRVESLFLELREQAESNLIKEK